MTGGFPAAVAFLTRVSVRRDPVDRASLAASVPWFPLVGALVGLAVAGAYWAAGALLAPLPAAAVALSAQLLVTGALHEDGLADVADAVGGPTAADRQRIMHDPVHGTYGVLALVCSVALRVGALATLGPAAATAALVAAHSLGRGAALALLEPDQAADRTGLLADHAGELGPRARLIGGASALTLAVISLAPTGTPWVAPAALVLAAAATAGVGAWGRRTFGHLSGDLLGATEQVVEVGVLLAVAVARGGG